MLILLSEIAAVCRKIATSCRQYF